MTNDEAKTKICPFSFISAGPWSCFASGCMAWRVHTSKGQERLVAEHDWPLAGFERTDGVSSQGFIRIRATEDLGDCIAFPGGRE